MQIAPLPPDEEERIAQLHSYNILDTLEEQEYNDIVQLVAQICGTPMADVSFVDRNRQWFKAAIGLENRETPRDVAFCAHTILNDGPLIVPDATEDERFHDNPLVTDNPAIRFYAGMPLTTPDGYRIGSLCAIDTEPRTLTQEQRYALQVLANHVVNLLELRRRTRQLEDLSDFKSRMLAVLAHDLRSPIAALTSLLSVLNTHGLDEQGQQSVMGELTERLKTADYLIGNIVGWAANTLSESEKLHIGKEPIDLHALAHELKNQALYDLQRKHNTLEVNFAKLPLLHSDRNTILFILRNLVANANKFTSDGMIRLTAHQMKDGWQFRVSDSGIGMNREQADQLFDWQIRRSRAGTHGEQGAGLALLLCQDMAHSMGGEIAVVSEEGKGSTFTLSVRA